MESYSLYFLKICLSLSIIILRFIHVFAYVRSSLPVTAECCFIRWIYRVCFGSSHQLSQSCCEHLPACFYMHILSFLLRMEWLSHMVSVCLTFFFFNYFCFLSNLYTQYGAQTHNLEIRNCMLY